MKKSRLYVFILFAVLLVSLLPTLVKAEEPVVAYIMEDITTDTVWPAGDYYICKTADNREPRVINGATLTIQNGANVFFSTRTTTEIPESDGKYPYSSLTVTKGSLVANGVTFTTVPDIAEQTTWQDACWSGIRAIGVPDGATSLSFTDCTFEYSGFTDTGTLYGTQTNSLDSEVNISVSGCTFRDPNEGATAIRYDNGHNTVGTGTISVSNSTFTGYGRGVQVIDNQEDPVNTTVTGCTFSSMSVRPLEINGGQQASVSDCTFNDFVVGQHNGAVLIFNTYSATSQTQTVVMTGNTFNYDDTANVYPVLIGAGTKINENLATTANNTFDMNYPEAYRYIELTTGVGYLDRHRVAVWGEVGMPYLLTSGITITGTDESNQSSLTINPGVTVCLGDGTGDDNLAVRGTLTAVGTPAKPITFTKIASVTYGNEITASNTLKGSIVLKHCVMDGLHRGIGIVSPGNVAGSTILLENCTVQNTQHSMHLAGRNVSVKNCTLIGKGLGTGGGQYVDSITIEGCSITSSEADSGDGVFLEPAKSVVLKNCLITGFSNCGIAVINNDYETLEAGAPLIENCTVTGNGYGVVFSKGFLTAYGAFIRNSIIAGNAGLDLASKVYTSGEYDYPVTIVEESIAYSLIGDDGTLLPFSLSYYDHPSLGKIHMISSSSYSNRVPGEPLFANAANGDYHLQSTEGRWNGSAWVTDASTSSGIDAGDPTSAYSNEPAPNGGRINIGYYGNTVEASKSGIPSIYYTVTLPDGKVEGYDAYTIEAHGGSTSPVIANGSYSFTITVGNAFYKTDDFMVKANSIELTPDSDTGVYTIQDITAEQTVTVEGVARISTPTIMTQPVDQSVAIGQEAVFSVVATGYNLTYSWQVSSDGGSTWENITGATSAQYSVLASTLSQSGQNYRCWVTSSADSGIPYFGTQSNVVTLTITDSGTQYNISVSASPAAGGTVSGNGSVNPGESVTVRATPNGSYRFVKWTEGGSQLSTSASYTFNATANRTLVAVFENASPANSPTRSYTPPPVTEVDSGDSIAPSKLNRLISSGEKLTVEGEEGTKLVFDTDALKGISSQAGTNVKAEIRDVSAEYQKTNPGKQVFSLTVSSNDKTITGFGGSVEVFLPYELKDDENAKDVTVWHLMESGTMVEIPCTYDSTTKLVNFTVSHFSLYMVGVASKWDNPFSDVKETDWFYDAIRFVYENSLMVGTEDTVFSPMGNTSRGMIVTIIWRLDGKPEAVKPITFTDVVEGKWYYEAVAWAAEKGIVNGYSAVKFGPEDDITREQITKILLAYASYKSYNVSARDDLSAFIGSPSSWALEGVQWAVAEGFIQGKGGGLLDLQEGAKRCESAEILQRFIEKY